MKLAVLGATGHTGALLVPALRERGAEVVACGRDAARLRKLEGEGVTTRQLDVADAAALDALFADVDGVANLAGPFLATGLKPVEAALRAGIAYVDTTGEQAFMHTVRERFHEKAVAAGVPIVNALAFEYSFGDLAARARFPEGGDELHVFYRPRRTSASAGTKKSVVRVMASQGLGYEDGRLVPVPAARHRRSFETADGERLGLSFAGGEVLTVPRHTPFRTVRTYVPTSPRNARLAPVLAPLARLALRGPVLDAVERAIDRRHRAPDNAKASGEIHLVTRDRHVVVHTPDPYVATAHVCAEGLSRLVAGTAKGVLAPAEAFDANEILGVLKARMPGFDVRVFSSGKAS